MKQERTTVLTLKNDIIFKAVFGRDTVESKVVLIALLNHILERKEDPIIDLDYKNPFNVREFDDEKEFILDIKVVTSGGEIIDIEMQMIRQDDLKERLIVYHGGLIRDALKKGEAYGRMKETITICIVDAVVFEETEQFMNCFYFMEEKEHFKFSEKTSICCIELPKVNPKERPVEELTPLEVCLEYLKYADEKGSAHVDELVTRGGKELEMAQALLEKATEDEILREKAIAREKYLQDQISIQYNMEQNKKRIEEMQRDVEEKQRDVEEKQRDVEEMQRDVEEKQRDVEEKQRDVEEKMKCVEAARKDIEAERKDVEEMRRSAEQMMKEARQMIKDAEQRK